MIQRVTLAITLAALAAMPNQAGAQAGAPAPAGAPDQVAATTTTPTATTASAAATIQVSPNPLGVTTFFDGADLQLTGDAPAGMELAVLLTGERQDIELKRKGKVWGLLWMNVGEVSFEALPSAYLLATTVPIDELAPEAVRERNAIGLDVLGASCGATDDDETRQLFTELIKLKQREELYGAFEGAVSIEPAGPDRVRLEATLPVPSRIPEEPCHIALWGFAGGTAQQLAEAELAVQAEGVTHDIAALAHHHGLVYGILALIIALVVGFATGMVFGLAGKGGH